MTVQILEIDGKMDQLHDEVTFLRNRINCLCRARQPSFHRKATQPEEIQRRNNELGQLQDMTEQTMDLLDGVTRGR